KLFPATQTCSLYESTLVCSVCYLSFFRYLSFLTNYSSTPPGGMSKQKTPSHFTRRSQPEHSHDPNPTASNHGKLRKNLQPLKAYLSQTRLAVLQENALTRQAQVLPRSRKNQPATQPSLAPSPDQPDEPRHLPRLPPDPAEQRRH